MRVITFSVFAFLAVFAQAEKRLAGAHVHGLNYVQIISDGSTLQVNYEFPIAQLQEHDEHKDDEHKDDEHKHEEHEHDEHENVEDIAHLHVELKDMDNILEFIRLPDSAECTQKTINQSVKNVVAGEETMETRVIKMCSSRLFWSAGNRATSPFLISPRLLRNLPILKRLRLKV